VPLIAGQTGSADNDITEITKKQKEIIHDD